MDVTSSGSFVEGRNASSLFLDISSRTGKVDVCHRARFQGLNYLLEFIKIFRDGYVTHIIERLSLIL